RLPKPRVDHVDPRIAQSPRDHLHPTVVPIQPHLPQQHPRPVRQVGAAVLLLELAGGGGQGGRHAGSLVGGWSGPAPAGANPTAARPPTPPRGLPTRDRFSPPVQDGQSGATYGGGSFAARAVG